MTVSDSRYQTNMISITNKNKGKHNNNSVPNKSERLLLTERKWISKCYVEIIRSVLRTTAPFSYTYFHDSTMIWWDIKRNTSWRMN